MSTGLARDAVLDALDVETYMICGSPDEARALGIRLMRELGFKDVDVVFLQFCGTGARLRLRAYVHRPGDRYRFVEGQA